MADQWPGRRIDQQQQWPGRRIDAQQAPQQDPVSGSILPLSRDEQGNLSFDSNAGIVGAVKRAVTLPGDVFTGKVDPMSDEAMGRSLELGALASPVNPGIRAGARAIPGVAQQLRRPKVEPPSSQALKDAAGKGYDQLRDMGVDYRSDAVAGMARGIRSELEQDGILAELAPKTFRLIEKLENPPDRSVASLAGIEAARRSFRHAAQDFSNPTEQEAAKRALAGLDGFVERGDPSTVVAGPASEAGRVAAGARGNYAASKRSDRLTGLEETAERRAAASNSGQNIDNAIRQRVASILQNPKQRAGFNKEEIAALESVARGTAGRNLTRRIGNLLGGGGGLGQGLTGAAGAVLGGTVGGPAGAGVGALAATGAGMTAKAAANAMTKRSLGKADKATRKRSPLYQETQRAAPLEAINPQKRAALMRALLLAQSGPRVTTEQDQDSLLRELIRQSAQ
jgi:hypothetical protein